MATIQAREENKRVRPPSGGRYWDTRLQIAGCEVQTLVMMMMMMMTYTCKCCNVYLAQSLHAIVVCTCSMLCALGQLEKYSNNDTEGGDSAIAVSGQISIHVLVKLSLEVNDSLELDSCRVWQTVPPQLKGSTLMSTETPLLSNNSNSVISSTQCLPHSCS